MPETETRRAVMQIVAVDHCPTDYEILRSIVNRNAIRLEFATSGCDALRLAKELRVDLWLICTQLPDFSGFDIVEMLQPLPLGTAVFLIGTEYRSADEMRALQLGVTKYLVKPLSAEWWREVRQRPLSKEFLDRTSLVRASPAHAREAKP